jgi:hypothetical protein
MGYHPENYTEFLGKSSPSATKYNPSTKSTKSLEPRHAISKFERFHKPSSLAKLQ